MAILVSKRLVSGTEGLNYVASPGGFSIQQIVSVHRAGTQHDEVHISDVNDGGTRQWAYQPFTRRIYFPSAQPFNAGGELIHIILKTIV